MEITNVATDLRFVYFFEFCNRYD